MLWFSADWHAYGEEDLRCQFTPFKTSEEMLNTLIENTNKVVPEDDTLIIVGDLCDWTPTNCDVWRKGLEVANYLKCNVELVVGNNEQRAMEQEKLSISEFAEICGDYGIFSVQFSRNIRLTVSERIYAIHDPRMARKDAVNIFGHVHLTGPFTGVGYNVSCYCNNFYPISLDTILAAKKVVNMYESKDASATLVTSTPYGDGWA